jgi:hypothetical protein
MRGAIHALGAQRGDRRLLRKALMKDSGSGFSLNQPELCSQVASCDTACSYA